MKPNNVGIYAVLAGLCVASSASAGAITYVDSDAPLGTKGLGFANSTAGVIKSTTYEDCVVATNSIGELKDGYTPNVVVKLTAASGNVIESLDMSAVYILTDELKVSHLQVSYSLTGLDGSWSVLSAGYVPLDYVPYTAYTLNLSSTALTDNLNLKTVYVKFDVLAAWSNHTGGSDMFWKALSITGTEAAAPVPEPAALSLLAAGAGLFLARRSRR